MKTYFGFAIADSMLPAECVVKKESYVPSYSGEIEAAINCCNSTHTETIKVANIRYGFELKVPEKPPSVSLGVGDSIIVMGVRGLPRLTDNRHYTEEEIASATFAFSKYTVVE